MAGDITKFDFSDNLRNNLGLQNVQPPINKVASFVQPVAEIIKFSNVVRNISSNTTASASIFVTPTDKDFYLCYVELNYIKDAACDLSDLWVRVVVDGANTVLLRQTLPPAAASTNSWNLNLSYPLKLTRGSGISLLGTFTAGTCTKLCTIIGVQI